MAVTSQPASSPQTMNSSAPNPNPPKNPAPVAKTQETTSSGTVQVPEKESVFKKWWFWLIIALIVLGGAGAFYYLSYMA